MTAKVKAAKAREPGKDEMLATLDLWIATYEKNHAMARIVRLLRDARRQIMGANW